MGVSEPGVTWARVIVINFLYIFNYQPHVKQFDGAKDIAFISKPYQWL